MASTLRLFKASRKRPSHAHDPKLKAGTSFCKCSACGEYFKSERAFERHRIGEFGPNGDRGCAPAARLPELGLNHKRGSWHLLRRMFSTDRRRELDEKRTRMFSQEAA
jgi:hypothetical protein